MQKSSGYFKDEIIHGISLSLKYLQHLQAEASKLNTEGFGITKKNPHFQNLATYLDLLFSFGLSDPRKGYWGFVKHFVHSATIELIETHKAASTAIYKGQLWLFLALSENTLNSYIELSTANQRKLKSFYKKFALLRDPECSEILKTLLHGLDSLTFNLDINNPYLGYENEAINTVEKNDNSLFTTQCFQKEATWSDTKDGGMVNGVSRILHDEDLDEDDDNIAVHLKKGRRKRKDKDSHSSELVSTEDDGISSVESIGLEDDHYIPEVDDSTPITVSFVLPDNLLQPSLADNPYIKDETMYSQFLLAYNKDSRKDDMLESEETLIDRTLRDSCDVEQTMVENESGMTSKGGEAESESDERKGDNENEDDDTRQDVSEGLYKITYVSDLDEDGGEKSDEDIDRKSSVDSFDEFCRKRSVTKETGHGDSSCDGDSEHEYEATHLEDSLNIHDDLPCSLDADRIDNERELQFMELSPHNLPQQSINRVMHARMDTSIGILLPTLPRRPSPKDAAKLAHDFSADHPTILTLSLEIFDDEGEQFGKLFRCFVGSLHGIHKKVEVVLSNERVYILNSPGQDGRRFSTIKSFTYDSINKIQTGTNFQDVNIKLDDGICHLWTCDEVATRNLISSLKSGIKYGRSKGSEEEPIGQYLNNGLSLALKEFLLFVEKSEDFELFYFGIVQFCPLVKEGIGDKVLKSGYLLRKQSYLGVVGVWDQSFFSLRGHLLYEYAVKDGDQVKQVLNLRDKCGGCARVKDKDRQFTFRIFSKDGVSSILELAADSDEDANDWILSVCLVMADVKVGSEPSIGAGQDALLPCGVAVTGTGIYTFQIQIRTNKLQLIALAEMQDITRICVDNEERNYCALLIDSDDGQSNQQKSTWILQFESELELGKFEQHVFACWHSIYQIPLQFVLLADGPMKRNTRRILERVDKGNSLSVLESLQL